MTVDLHVRSSLRSMTAVWMGPLYAAARDRCGRHPADRRQSASAPNARVAWPEFFREGKAAGRDLSGSPPLLGAKLPLRVNSRHSALLGLSPLYPSKQTKRRHIGMSA